MAVSFDRPLTPLLSARWKLEKGKVEVLCHIMPFCSPYIPEAYVDLVYVMKLQRKYVVFLWLLSGDKWQNQWLCSKCFQAKKNAVPPLAVPLLAEAETQPLDFSKSGNETSEFQCSLWRSQVVDNPAVVVFGYLCAIDICSRDSRACSCLNHSCDHFSSFLRKHGTGPGFPGPLFFFVLKKRPR